MTFPQRTLTALAAIAALAAMAALVAAAAMAAAAARSAPAPVTPAPAAPAAADPSVTTGAPDMEWGPPVGGLVANLRLEGEAMVGGKIAFTLSLRSAAGQPVALPPVAEVYGWALFAQSTGGTKRAFWSQKVYFATNVKDWPKEVAGEKPLTVAGIDLASSDAFASEDGKRLLMAYVKGEDAGAKPVGKMNKVLSTGRWMVKFMVRVPVAGAAPAVVTSSAAEVLVQPPDLKTLSPEARAAFEADLLKQYNRDAWSGQQAHDTAVRLGPDVLPELLKAAFDTSRPPHARLWLVTSLADIHDERAVDALIKLLDDPMDGVRSVVAYHGEKQNSPRLDAAIIAKVTASKDGGLAAWAALGFMIHRGTVPEAVLKAGLESSDPQARAKVAETLAQHASERNVMRLAELLGDKDERVRSMAASLLEKCDNRSPGVLGALVKALDLPGESARKKMCEALSKFSGQSRPYDPSADQATRDRTIAEWKAWWARQSSK